MPGCRRGCRRIRFRVTAITDLLDAGRAAGGRAIPRRACGAANDGALRPAAEEGDAEYRRADFDLTLMLSYRWGVRIGYARQWPGFWRNMLINDASRSQQKTRDQI